MKLPTVNTQSREPINHDTLHPYVTVKHIWYTIQGEGPLVGTPAVFVRLAGCNLQCPACDTDYTSDRRSVTPEEIFKEAKSLLPPAFRTSLLVLTGGEPFRQDIGELARVFLMERWHVQVETNGTIYLDDFPKVPVSIICSPKTPKVHPELERYITAYKYVLRADAVDVTDGLPTDVLGTGNRPARPGPSFLGQVFVQPEDDPDPVRKVANLKATVRTCMEFGYRLSLQTHKLIGVD